MNHFFRTFFGCLFFSFFLVCYNSYAGGVVPVYVHDFEGHAGYTDMNIQNLICELNKNFEAGGGCSTYPEYSGIRFSLQSISRHPAPVGGSGLTPNAFMLASGGGTSVSLAPSYGIHIFLYDFYGGAGVYLYGDGYPNVILLSLSGFTGPTLTHEMGHAFGLAHIDPTKPGGTLEAYYSPSGVPPTGCSYPWSSGTSPAPASNNFLVTSTGPGSCMFTPNQVKIMSCNYEKRWKPSSSIYSSLIASHGALLTSSYCSPPLISFTINSNPTANLSVATDCNLGFLFYTYSVDYCPGPSTSIFDCDNCPVSGSSIPLQPCTEGILTVYAHYSYGINAVTRTFDTRTPGCVTGFSCDLSGGETSRTAKEISENDNATAVKIFPSLAQDRINVAGVFDGTEYAILDLNGRSILTGILNNYKIDISPIESGIYIIRFKNNSTPFKFYKL